ncbi:hypothetical protein Droror1_Dr00009686 [Drosera rotundifolia]
MDRNRRRWREGKGGVEGEEEVVVVVEGEIEEVSPLEWEGWVVIGGGEEFEGHPKQSTGFDSMHARCPTICLDRDQTDPLIEAKPILDSGVEVSMLDDVVDGSEKRVGDGGDCGGEGEESDVGAGSVPCCRFCLGGVVIFFMVLGFFGLILHCSASLLLILVTKEYIVQDLHGCYTPTVHICYQRGFKAAYRQSQILLFVMCSFI